ncbi:pantoate--beta-alanine ligase, partial [Candidatus Marinamargulisbacteria bacterium SCGC AG-439-L15]
MQQFSTVETLSAYLESQQRGAEFKVGFVPTMGALHEGHLSLLRQSCQDMDITVVSIFVNPTQFGPSEDFETYPRTLEQDKALLAELGPLVLFTPTIETVYPNGLDNSIQLQLPGLASLYCGKTRPQFFHGVCSVVLRLLNSVRPTTAYFGEKDFQQSVLIKQMVRDLRLAVKIETGPIVREMDGLAMSSRNLYLSPSHRQEASVLYDSLCSVRDKVVMGERRASDLLAYGSSLFDRSLLSLEYLAIVDAHCQSLPVIEE